MAFESRFRGVFLAEALGASPVIAQVAQIERLPDPSFAGDCDVAAVAAATIVVNETGDPASPNALCP